ncbi:MAG: hypothetical protein ABI379_10330 [Rhodanobacter sp.]
MILRKHITTIAICAALALPAAILPMPSARAGVVIGVGINIGIAPPPLPVYLQPALPAPGYLWTPGFWAYGDAGYYWVPGAWVLPPMVGVLWTPGYWAWFDGYYRWHTGYWGPRVGFYGGVNYGYGYGGIGFVGGRWNNGVFAYNRAAANFGRVRVTNVYNNTTIVRQNTIVNNYHVSYNGGANGIRRQPTAQEGQFLSERRLPPTANQDAQRRVAGLDRGQLASVNHGRPATLAAVDHAAYASTAQARERAQPITTADREQGRRYRPNDREANQSQRIANGLNSGQMTSGEAARADQRQATIDSQVRNDRQANGGALTTQQREQVNREQNGASRQIYNENHNGTRIAPNAVDYREANQQQRVANGLRDGRETSGEAARAEQRQAGLDRQVQYDRAANGGRLDPRQSHQVNQRENKDSRQVSGQQHDDRGRPPKKDDGKSGG